MIVPIGVQLSNLNCDAHRCNQPAIVLGSSYPAAIKIKQFLYKSLYGFSGDGSFLVDFDVFLGKHIVDVVSSFLGFVQTGRMVSILISIHIISIG